MYQSQTHTAALLACASHRHSKKLHLTQLRLTQPDTLSQSLRHDASMVCPCGHQAAHRARNMEPARRKEQRSTCPQSVWDATTVHIHHEAKVPNTWWAAEDT